MRIDLLYLLRMLRRSPASAIAVILTLSLTLGAGASIFAVVDAVLFTPPPFSDPDALVTLGETPIDDPTALPRAVSYATFEAWRERAGSLAIIEAFDGTNLTLTGLGAAERISATYVTSGFPAVVGVTPALGRTLGPDDVGRRVAVVTHGFWRGKLAADPQVIGQQIVLGGLTHTIVGVLPERFSFALDRSDLWLPFPVAPAQAVRDGYRVRVLARLGANAPAAQLTALLDDVSRESSAPKSIVATPVATAIAGDAAKTLTLLAAAAVLALLIAFTNLAGLLMVRAIDRRRELAVRSALGARPFEIAKQLLIEAEALVLMGILGGVLLAWWMTPVVRRLALDYAGAAVNGDVVINWWMAGSLSIVAVLCGGICGLLPALLATRTSPIDLLRRGVTQAPRELAWRRVFVTGEIAIAFVLLVSVTLLGRNLLRMLEVDPGFDARGVLAMQVSVPAAEYANQERVVAFYSALQSGLEERLGPRTISIVNELPLTGDGGRSLVSLRREDAGPEAVVREAGTSYFGVMRIPLLAGRAFTGDDNASARPRVVVSVSIAARLFPSGQPIGRQIWLSTIEQPAEIIGVVGDVKHGALDEALAPTVYLSAWQSSSRSRIVVVRSPRSDPDVIAAVREQVARLDGNLPVYSSRSMEDVVARSPGMPARRVLTTTFMGFALLGIVLGGLGLFGVVLHDVSRRHAELGVRIALGADPMRILRTTIGQGALMVCMGEALGGVLSFWAARALGHVLAAPDRLDALSIGAVAAAVIAGGVAAVFPAALRAARIDPLTALRAE